MIESKMSFQKRILYNNQRQTYEIVKAISSSKTQVRSICMKFSAYVRRLWCPAHCSLREISTKQGTKILCGTSRYFFLFEKLQRVPFLKSCEEKA